MLAVYFGTDTRTVRAEAQQHARTLAGEAGYVVLSGDAYESGRLADTVGGVSLFGERQVFLIDSPQAELAEELAQLLPALGESSNQYVVIEGPLLAAAKKLYQKHTEAVQEYKAAATERVDVFAINNSLVKKDKRQLWLHLQTQLQAGIAPEEIIGVLWWQLKSVRLAALTHTAAEAGMKDFPYRKAQSALQTMSQQEAERLSHSLLTLYHQGHSGEADITLALEQWVLGL